MTYTHNITTCFSNVTAEQFDDLKTDAHNAITILLNEAESGTRPLFNLKNDGTNLDEIKSLAATIRERFSHLVILGTGGSTLTGQALMGLKQAEQQYANASTQLHFMDNVDPHTFELMISSLPLKDTCFLTISKSGGTLETLAQFSICLNHIINEEGTSAASEHFIIISDPTDSPLRRIAKKHNIPAYDHIANIGGRFSIFTNVALLPAAVAGLDIHAIRAGAQEVIDNLNVNSAPAEGAIINLLLENSGITNTILMPYIDGLQGLTQWWRQVWAESLGKNGKGSTPIPALGTLDQHSQQQLYLDGPRDKFFTFIEANRKGKGDRLNSTLLDGDELNYMHGKTLGDVITLSHQAVRQTFISAGLPVRYIEIDTLDEHTIGALAMHFCIETALCGYMRGIDPYDQPAVEDAKLLAKSLLQA